MFCENCGSQIPEGSKFCISCGASVPELNPVKDVRDMFEEAPDTMPVEQKKRSHNVVIGLAALMVLIFVAVIVYKIFTPGGNLRKLVNAAKTTVASGFEFNISVKEEDRQIKYNGFLSVNEEDSEIQFQYEKESSNSSTVRTYAYLLDDKYIGQATVRKPEGSDEYRGSGYKTKHKVEMKAAMDLVMSLKKKDIAKVNYEKLIKNIDDDVYDLVEDYIEPKDIGKAINKVIKTLEKDDSLEIEKSGNTYTVKVDTVKAIKAASGALEDYVDKDVIKALKELSNDIKDSDDEGLDKIKVEIELEKKYISEIQFKLGDISYKISISDYGTDKSIKKEITEFMEEEE